MVLGMFRNRDFAENAILDLESKGFNPRDISIVMRDQNEAQEVSHSTGASVAEGAFSGMATGSVVGGITGLLVGIGAIAVPGLGALLIGGPLAAALGLSGAAATTATGAVTGALAGGLIGGLVGLGVSEEDAQYYDSQIRDGGILLAVPERGRRSEVVEILEYNHAQNVRTITDNFEADYRSPFLPNSNSYRDDRYYNSGYVGAKGGEVDDDSRSVLERIKDRLSGRRR